MHRFFVKMSRFLRDNALFTKNCEKIARKIPRISKTFCTVFPNRCRQNTVKEDENMAQNELKKELQRMMQKCPQCLTPRKIYRYTPLSENRIYELIRTGELPSFIYQGTYVVNKDDVIEYLLNYSDDDNRRYKAKSKESGHGA